MNENIIYINKENNTDNTVIFSPTIDVGYYRDVRNKTRCGAISVSVQLDSMCFKKYREKITQFGFCVLSMNEKGTKNIICDSAFHRLINKNGTFNMTVLGIPEENFYEELKVIPFIQICDEFGEKRLFGDTIHVSVCDGKTRTLENLRWLGDELKEDDLQHGF